MTNGLFVRVSVLFSIASLGEVKRDQGILFKYEEGEINANQRTVA